MNTERPSIDDSPAVPSGKRIAAAVRQGRAAAATNGGGRPQKGSRRTILNFWLDASLLVVFFVLGVVAIILQFVFPPGTSARGWLLWGLTYGQWCSVQFGLLCLLALGVLVHVMLHWSWVCGVVARRFLGQTQLPDDGIRTLYGVGLLIALLNLGAGAVAIAWLTIRHPPGF